MTAAIPVHPTKPHTIRKGCHEKYLHSPLGCVPAKYPTVIENTKKKDTNAWYIEDENAYQARIDPVVAKNQRRHTKETRESVSSEILSTNFGKTVF